MEITRAILDLISDDRYLLWEVRAAAGNDLDLEDLIGVVVDLVHQRIVTCSSGPIMGNGHMKMLSSEDSISELIKRDNWIPPKTDDVEAIWLQLTDA